jgi:hypothetical protein
LDEQEKKRLAPGFQGSIAGIFVEDNGLSIPEDIKASALFRPFFTTKEMGTGLGLAVVTDLVERHGGVVRVDSSGDLTIFEVLLPSGDRVPCWDSLCSSVCPAAEGGQDCTFCEVRAQKVGLFCWTVKGKAVRAETGFWPNKCLACPVFKSTNLSHTFKSDMLTSEE